MTFPECGVRFMVSEFAATRGRVRKLIRVRKLAATHTLEKIRRVRMFEKQVFGCWGVT